MSNSSLYQRAQIGSLAGGLDRQLRRSLVPPGAWHSAQRFEARIGNAEKSLGFRHFVSQLLSVEFNDFVEIGAVYDLTVEPDGGMPSGYKTTFKTFSANDWARGFGSSLAYYHLRVVEGRFGKIAEDPLALPLSIISQFDSSEGGIDIVVYECDGAYSGPLPGSPDWPAGVRKLMLRQFPDPTESCPTTHLESLIVPSGSEAFYACTPREIHRFTPPVSGLAIGLASAFSRLNPVVSDGTVNFGTGSPIVTGIATTFLASGIGPGWLFESQGAGGAFKWARLVASVASNTSLTLASSPPFGDGGSARTYKAVNVFQKLETSRAARRRPWSVTKWITGSPGPLLVVANGFDRVKKHDGAAATVLDLGGLSAIDEGGSPVDVQSARVVRPFADRLLLGYTKENGTAHSTRWRWSDRVNCESWTGFKFRDMATHDEIVGADVLGSVLVSMNRSSIWNVREVVAPYDFGFERRVSRLGCMASQSIQNVGDFGIAFLGPDDVYVYDLLRENSIGRRIRDLVFEDFNDDMRELTRSYVIPEKSLYLLSFPTKSHGDLENFVTLAWNWKDDNWSAPLPGFMGFGRFLQRANPVIDDYVGIVIDSEIRRIDSRLEGKDAPIDLAGSAFGGVYQLYTTGEDDGADSFAELELGTYDFGYEGLKRLAYIVLEGDSDGSRIEVFVGTSMNGQNVLYDAVPRALTFSETNSELDRMVPVNRVGKFFTVKIRAPYRNELPKIHSIDAYWTPMGR